MRIKTNYDPPPIPIRQFDWSAYDDDTYGGEPGDPIGWGKTEAEAVADLTQQLEQEERDNERSLHDRERQ